LISEEDSNPGPWTRKQKECLDCLRSGERLRAGEEQREADFP
jgi:hypothetical protein